MIRRKKKIGTLNFTTSYFHMNKFFIFFQKPRSLLSGEVQVHMQKLMVHSLRNTRRNSGCYKQQRVSIQIFYSIFSLNNMLKFFSLQYCIKILRKWFKEVILVDLQGNITIHDFLLDEILVLQRSVCIKLVQKLNQVAVAKPTNAVTIFVPGQLHTLTFILKEM